VPVGDPPDPDEIRALESARTAVETRIARACARASRDPASVRLVAVSKTVGADRLRAAVAAGLTTLGENRVQEAADKRPTVVGAAWELVGPLQSNKARRALATFDRIQTVDSLGLAERLDRLAGEDRPGERYPVLLQVNVDDDPAKAGFAPDAVVAALPALLAMPRLQVEGLMTVGRFGLDEDGSRATFRSLRALSERLRAERLPAGVRPLGPELSMGMTDDFELAIEEGATTVRVGRALFGERPHHHGDGDVDHAH
jgi:pyridoxal phosphate enzyme (YggS family)